MARRNVSESSSSGWDKPHQLREQTETQPDGDGHRQVEEGGYVVTPAVTPEGTLYVQDQARRSGDDHHG